MTALIAPPPAPPRPRGTNDAALIGFVFSASSVLVPVVLNSIAGIVISAIGLTHARRAEAATGVATRRAFARAGIIVGIVMTALGVLLIVAVIAVVIWATSPDREWPDFTQFFRIGHNSEGNLYG